jgi:hypothetical protein
MTTLAKRATACARWRWIPGMLSLNGIRVVRGEEGVAFAGADQDLPDLRDPATLGCVLALVRDVWGRPTLSAVRRYFWGETEAEALVAALEAAGGGE